LESLTCACKSIAIMWKRNLFFIGAILVGILGMRAALFPPPLPPHAPHFDPAKFDNEDFRTIVANVDAALGERYTREGLLPAPPADELTVARRLSLALTGSIPSLQQIRQFEAYQAGHRLQWWLEGTLQDRRSADYLAERFARVFVGTEDGPFLVYRRRRFVSWLSDELLKNRPYDQLVRELIAAEGLWTDKPATNFVTVTVEQGDGKSGQPNPERLAGRVARAFLGVRIDCAQCHNHFFEKWKQADFQGLAAFFGQVKEGFTGTYDGEGEFTHENRKTGVPETIAPRVPFLADLVPAAGSRRQQLATWVTHPANPYFARVTVNRAWALMFGRPMLDKVDDVSSSEDIPPALPLLADDFVAHDYDLRRLFRVIAATEAFQRDSAADHEITEAHEKQWAAYPLTRLRPDQVAGSVQQAASLTTLNADTHILLRLVALGARNQFLKRYGDTGEDEFDNRTGTIPQRLLMMNGELVHDQTKEGIFTAASRIGSQARDDRAAVRIAYLTVLTRPPTDAESAHFEKRLADTSGKVRSQRMEDLYWALLNSTEFSWNH
jgi:hypothetical protein